MKRSPISSFIISLSIVIFVFCLISCDPISLKQTIENLVLGWQAAVTLTSPTNDELRAEKTPLLDWEDSGGAAGYEIQIVEVNDFDGVDSISVTDSQYEIPDPLELSDERFWRVRAVDSEGTGGEWSEPWSFMIKPSETPVITASIDIGGNPYILLYDDGYCYIPTGALGVGIKVFDVSDPSNPIDVSPADFIPFDNGDTPLVIRDQYLYFIHNPGAGSQQLYIFDITDPTSPVQIGTYVEMIFDAGSGDEDFSRCSGSSMAVSGPALFVAGNLSVTGKGILKIRLDDPENPVPDSFVAQTASIPDAFNLEVNGHYGYLTISGVGVEIFRFVPNFTNVTTYSIPTMAYGFVHFVDDYAFVSDQDGALVILNILDPSNPSLVSSFDPGEGTAGGFVYGSFSFIGGTSTGKLYVLDIRDIANPVELLTIEDSQVFTNYVSGNYAYGVDYYDGKFTISDLVPED